MTRVCNTNKMKNQNNNFFLNFSQEEQKYLLPLLEEESFEDNQIVFKKNAF